MNDLRWWAVLVAGSLIVIAGYLGRHPIGRRSRLGLSQGITLFFSENCPGCLTARQNLERTGVPFTLATWDGQRSMFEAAKVTRVPTVVVTDDSGSSVRWEGTPSSRQVVRAVARSG